MNALLSTISELGLATVESTTSLSGRKAQLVDFDDCAFGEHWESDSLSAIVPDGKLFTHQAEALPLIDRGNNAVVATGTASGKSLAFQLPVLCDLRHGEGTHLVFYPQKSLAADQKNRWANLCQALGIDTSLIQEINGDVPPVEREAALTNARVLLVTHDVIHAWMMRQVSSPAVQRFLRRLKYVVLDEAHALEGAFGSSTAFLMRRLQSARAKTNPEHALQFIAASATVHDPEKHLEALTGLTFVAIDEDSNGAPRSPLTLAHIAGPEQGSAAEAQVASLVIEVIPYLGDDAFIVFADTRQGVERIARRIARDDVLPYRSGYEVSDRRAIEEALRRGELRGVISTSAMELGIDIPQFTFGINVGIPKSRKALRQRIGRVGRSKPGLFLLMAPPPSFAKLGSSFEDYVVGEIEPSPLYLENPFIQYSQARCMLEEGGIGTPAELAGDCEWPPSFAEMLKIAAPGATRPRELDSLAAAGGNLPHHNYPLRQIGDQTLALKIRGFADPLGTINLTQAIREAYPGATYYHMQRAHKVTEWRVNSYERSIILRPTKAAQTTHALTRCTVNASYADDEVIDERIMQCDTGVVAETRLQVTESVEGFRTEKGTCSYGFLRQTNPRMRRQSREFATTGIVIQISEGWFSGARSDDTQKRHAIGKAIAEILCRDHSISTSEIGVAASQIALRNIGGSVGLEDAIVIYDDLHGGLRLTSKIFDLLPALADRLCVAADAAGQDALVDALTAQKFAAWVSGLKPAKPLRMGKLEVPAGQHLIFAPGSLVSFKKQGLEYERKLLAPKLFEFPSGDMLFYRYKCEADTQAWVPHDAVEPSGHQWSQVFWDPQTDEMRPCQ